MNAEDMSTVDFETEKVGSRPQYPPKPVGVAIKLPGQKPEYLAFGHPTGNNADIATVREKLKDAYRAKGTIFHHSAFDIDVSQIHFGLTPRRAEDTLYLSFLHDPYERDMSLKPLAEKHLKMPATERDELKDWIINNVPECKAKNKQSKWGEHIDKAPGHLVGKYAVGDIVRTERLYRLLREDINSRGMNEAYERELACTQISLDMERGGIRVDRKRLGKCLLTFNKMDHDIMRRIAKKLRINPKDLQSEDNKKGFNLNSSAQLADALQKAGKLDSITRTATGKVSTKMVNLQAGCNDKELLNLLAVHSVCQKYRTSFMESWLEKSAIGGRINPNFNQVRGYDEGGGGARSGRFSSSDPNLQNVPANPEESQNKDTLLLMEKWLKDDYHYTFRGLRDYLIPDEDCVMICVDYNQQELRILAHFERDVLMRAYIENPRLDIHEYCRQLVKDAIGIDFPRKHIKVTVFGIVYGMGVGKLADRLDVDKATAKKVKDGILTAVPGIRRLMDDLKELAAHDEPLITWGGRQYFCEEPRYDREEGQWMSFEYKMLNYKIQPSAADCTKQGMINVREQVPQVRIAAQIHDELVCMAPSKKYGPKIEAAMCDVKFRVPMLAEAKYSTTSWARAVSLEKEAT